MSSPVLRPTVERVDGTTTITFRHGKKRESSNMVAEGLHGLTDTLGGRNLILNFSEGRAIGSMGLATLINFHKRMQASGGRLTLTGLQPLVYQVFTVTRWTTFLEVHPVPAL